MGKREREASDSTAKQPPKKKTKKEKNKSKKNDKKKNKYFHSKKRDKKFKKKKPIILPTEKKDPKVQEFEKCLVGKPESSFIWVNYCAHFLMQHEIERARQILIRALKRINSTNEKEKMNIWKSWLLLEEEYGTDESMEKVYQEALKNNDPKPIYKQMIYIYKRRKELEKLYSIHKKLVKEDKNDLNNWLNYYEFCLTTSLLENKRQSTLKEVLHQIKGHLTRKQNVGFLARIGKILFKHGHFDAGRIKYEQLLEQFPKRFDILMIYIDMEIKHSEDKIAIRRLFNRSVEMNHRTKKIQTLFKKYLTYELNQTDSHKDLVKEKARAFLQRQENLD